MSDRAGVLHLVWTNIFLWTWLLDLVLWPGCFKIMLYVFVYLSLDYFRVVIPNAKDWTNWLMKIWRRIRLPFKYHSKINPRCFYLLDNYIHMAHALCPEPSWQTAKFTWVVVVMERSRQWPINSSVILVRIIIWNVWPHHPGLVISELYLIHYWSLVS